MVGEQGANKIARTLARSEVTLMAIDTRRKRATCVGSASICSFRANCRGPTTNVWTAVKATVIPTRTIFSAKMRP